MNLTEWQLWMYPYPTLVKMSKKRILFSKYPFKRLFHESDGVISLRDMFEERKKTPPQLKRCVLAIAKKEIGGKDLDDRGLVRAAISKAFAICTANLQKHGYLKKKSQSPTKRGGKSGRSKAGEKDHALKVAEYEKLLAKARGE